MSKKASDQVVDEAPGLGDTEALFPPSPDAVPVAANNSMKLPTEVWFEQGDAQFAIRNVTISKTKFYYWVAVLPQEVASQILDLFRASPTGDRYSVLPQRLITLYC